MDISEKYKKMLPAAILIVVAAAGILYYNKIQDDRKNAKPAIITEKDMNLSAEERKLVEGRLADIQEKIENPPKSITNIEKYSWNMQAGFQKMALGKLSEAKEYFIAASALQPGDYTSWVALYDVAYAMNDFDTARENIKKAISLDQGNPGTWKKYIQLENEKFKASNEQLNQLFIQAFAATRSDIVIVVYYAQFLEEKGDLKGALEQWRKALVADPESKNRYQAEVARLEGLTK